MGGWQFEWWRLLFLNCLSALVAHLNVDKVNMLRGVDQRAVWQSLEGFARSCSVFSFSLLRVGALCVLDHHSCGFIFCLFRLEVQCLTWHVQGTGIEFLFLSGCLPRLPSFSLDLGVMLYL